MTVQPAPYAPAAPLIRKQGISSLIYGWPKAGKSNLADSGPQPRLIVDIEGQATWTASRKTEWNPQHPPPQPPGMRLVSGYGQPSQVPEWESCLCIIREPKAIGRVYEVLNRGLHPFSSASVDSVTEMQQRLIDAMVGANPMQRDNWGTLLRQANWTIRQWRDLITHPVRPLWSVAFVAGMHADAKTGRYRPLLQGAGQDYIGYFVDLMGFLDAQPDGTRVLYTGPMQGYETGERLGGRIPPAAPIAYPGRGPGWTLESMAAHVLSS